MDQGKVDQDKVDQGKVDQGKASEIRNITVHIYLYEGPKPLKLLKVQGQTSPSN